MNMSKRGYISRYLLIIKRLRAKPYSTFTELSDFIFRQLEYLIYKDDDLSIGFSLRTMQRDIREIRNLFGIDIQFSKSEKGYYISQDEHENMNFQKMIEAFDIFNSLNLAHDLTPYIILQKQKPQGTENLYGLLHAIKNRLKIEFNYKKYWEKDTGQGNRTAEPYAIKEFKNRWYLIAQDTADRVIKSFALDRLTDLLITNHSFEYPADFNIDEFYKYCYGIVGPNRKKPIDVLLSFDPHQGNYIKSLPLHHTQQIILDNSGELQISLKIYPTFDFIMELLSFGDNAKVLKPKSLITTIRKAHENAFKQYGVTDHS